MNIYNLKCRPDIMTVGGSYFNFLHPDKSKITIEDIAHALSHVCRFNGHTRHFYSVAQHSVHCSEIVAPEYAMQALLHDATEAYLGDVTTPLKQLLDNYATLESMAWSAIAKTFGLPYHLDKSVKAADLTMLVTEMRDFMPEESIAGFAHTRVPPLAHTLRAWCPAEAKTKFLKRYWELKNAELAAAG